MGGGGVTLNWSPYTGVGGAPVQVGEGLKLGALDCLWAAGQILITFLRSVVFFFFFTVKKVFQLYISDLHLISPSPSSLSSVHFYPSATSHYPPLLLFLFSLSVTLVLSLSVLLPPLVSRPL